MVRRNKLVIPTREQIRLTAEHGEPDELSLSRNGSRQVVKDVRLLLGGADDDSRIAADLREMLSGVAYPQEFAKFFQKADDDSALSSITAISGISKVLNVPV